MIRIFILIGLLFNCVSFNKALAQTQPAESLQQQIKNLEELIQKEPDNPDHHWKLATFYCSQAMGKKCAAQAMQIMDLNPDKEKMVEAYNVASMGYNYSGEMKRSYEMIEKALEIDPENEMAVSLKATLEYSRDNFWSGQLPEKLSWYGFETVYELMQSMRTYGIGVTSPEGQGDCVLTSRGQYLCFQGLEGWIKKPNIILPNNTRVLLSYAKSKSDKPISLPSIGVTVDFPSEEIKSALEFSRNIKALIENSAPGVKVLEPKEIDVNGEVASIVDMITPDGLNRSVWYQFLVGRQIISVQFSSTQELFEKDYPFFKAFAESMKIDDSKPVGALRPPML